MAAKVPVSGTTTVYATQLPQPPAFAPVMQQRRINVSAIIGLGRIIFFIYILNKINEYDIIE